jgi:hypothetical protein
MFLDGGSTPPISTFIKEKMTVYVDNMHETPMGKYGRMKMCHMIADTVEELHEMADKIGVKRKWYQGDKTGKPHYDICSSKRKLAVEYGAKEITMREAVKILGKNNG